MHLYKHAVVLLAPLICGAHARPHLPYNANTLDLAAVSPDGTAGTAIPANTFTTNLPNATPDIAKMMMDGDNADIAPRDGKEKPLHDLLVSVHAIPSDTTTTDAVTPAQTVQGGSASDHSRPLWDDDFFRSREKCLMLKEWLALHPLEAVSFEDEPAREYCKATYGPDLTGITGDDLEKHPNLAPRDEEHADDFYIPEYTLDECKEAWEELMTSDVESDDEESLAMPTVDWCSIIYGGVLWDAIDEIEEWRLTRRGLKPVKPTVPNHVEATTTPATDSEPTTIVTGTADSKDEPRWFWDLFKGKKPTQENKSDLFTSTTSTKADTTGTIIAARAANYNLTIKDCEAALSEFLYSISHYSDNQLYGVYTLAQCNELYGKAFVGGLLKKDPDLTRIGTLQATATTTMDPQGIVARAANYDLTIEVCKAALSEFLYSISHYSDNQLYGVYTLGQCNKLYGKAVVGGLLEKDPDLTRIGTLQTTATSAMEEEDIAIHRRHVTKTKGAHIPGVATKNPWIADYPDTWKDMPVNQFLCREMYTKWKKRFSFQDLPTDNFLQYIRQCTAKFGSHWLQLQSHANGFTKWEPSRTVLSNIPSSTEEFTATVTVPLTGWETSTTEAAIERRAVATRPHTAATVKDHPTAPEPGTATIKPHTAGTATKATTEAATSYTGIKIPMHDCIWAYNCWFNDEDCVLGFEEFMPKCRQQYGVKWGEGLEKGYHIEVSGTTLETPPPYPSTHTKRQLAQPTTSVSSSNKNSTAEIKPEDGKSSGAGWGIFDFFEFLSKFFKSSKTKSAAKHSKHHHDVAGSSNSNDTQVTSASLRTMMRALKHIEMLKLKLASNNITDPLSKTVDQIMILDFLNSTAATTNNEHSLSLAVNKTTDDPKLQHLVLRVAKELNRIPSKYRAKLLKVLDPSSENTADAQDGDNDIGTTTTSTETGLTAPIVLPTPFIPGGFPLAAGIVRNVDNDAFDDVADRILPPHASPTTASPTTKAEGKSTSTSKNQCSFLASPTPLPMAFQGPAPASTNWYSYIFPEIHKYVEDHCKDGNLTDYELIDTAVRYGFNQSNIHQGPLVWLPVCDADCVEDTVEFLAEDAGVEKTNTTGHADQEGRGEKKGSDKDDKKSQTCHSAKHPHKADCDEDKHVEVARTLVTRGHTTLATRTKGALKQTTATGTDLVSKLEHELFPTPKSKEHPKGTTTTNILSKLKHMFGPATKTEETSEKTTSPPPTPTDIVPEYFDHSV